MDIIPSEARSTLKLDRDHTASRHNIRPKFFDFDELCGKKEENSKLGPKAISLVTDSSDVLS